MALIERQDHCICAGRTPARLRVVLSDWPLVSAPMTEKLTGASCAAVQRNLAWMEARVSRFPNNETTIVADDPQGLPTPALVVLGLLIPLIHEAHLFCIHWLIHQGPLYT